MSYKFAGALALACLMTAALAHVAEAQTLPAPAAGDQRAAAPQNTNTRADADETFDVNISERRITETNYENSTAVEVNGQDATDVRVQVGVAVAARSIDVLLRNVQGRVRFRASLEPVLRLLDRRRAVAPAAGGEMR